MAVSIQKQIAFALMSIDKHYAMQAANPGTKVEPYIVHFLQRYHIYRLEYFTPSRSVLFYVGFAPEKSVYILTNEPENYIKMAKDDPVEITSEAIAIDYATTYLEVTRAMTRLFYIIHKLEDITFRPNLDAEKTKQKAMFIEQYSSVITPPIATVADRQYRVTVYAIRAQSLEQHILTISRNGDLSSSISTFEQDLPLAYGL